MRGNLKSRNIKRGSHCILANAVYYSVLQTMISFHVVYIGNIEVGFFNNVQTKITLLYYIDSVVSIVTGCGLDDHRFGV
jgi:hypothetical protein